MYIQLTLNIQINLFKYSTYLFIYLYLYIYKYLQISLQKLSFVRYLAVTGAFDDVVKSTGKYYNGIIHVTDCREEERDSARILILSESGEKLAI